MRLVRKASVFDTGKFKVPSKFKTIFSVTSGNFFEMYDFMVYGLYASYIADTFFPNSNPYLSLIMSLAVFASGFLMRPLGAVILGLYIDHYGRRQGLYLTLCLMAAGMILITFTPSYASVGIAAPLLVLLGRLLQGFSAGVEIGSVSVYLAEIASPHQRALTISWQPASQQVSILLASLLGYVLNIYLNHMQMLNFGFRIPFFLGCLIVPIIFYQRLNLPETSWYLKHQRLKSSAILASAWHNMSFIMIGASLATFTMVAFYIITTFAPTYGLSILKLPGEDVYLVMIFAGLINFCLFPIMGYLADRYGYLYPMFLFSALGILIPYPLLSWLAYDPSFFKLLSIEFIFSLLYSGYSSAMVATLTRMMNDKSPTIGVASALSIGAIAGGLTPMVATALVHYTHDSAAPGLLLSISALLALSTVYRWREKIVNT